MSPEYLKGIRRILTVSADTELVSAPAYLRAAQHAPALNNFGSAMSIIQDELAHAHIGYRLLGDLGVDMDALIYERAPRQFKYPYAFDVPLDSWHELVMRQRALRPGRLRAALRRAPVEHVRALEARARQGRQGGDVPPAPRPHLGQEAVRGPRRQARRSRRPSTGCSSSRSSGSGCPTTRKRHGDPARVRLQGQDQRRAAPGLDGARWCRSWTRSASTCPRTCDEEQRALRRSTARSRRASTRRRKTWLLDEGAIGWDEVLVRWKRARADERATTCARLQRGYRRRCAMAA